MEIDILLFEILIFKLGIVKFISLGVNDQPLYIFVRHENGKRYRNLELIIVIIVPDNIGLFLKEIP